MKESIKHTLTFCCLPQRIVYNPIPPPTYSKTAGSVPAPCKPDRGGILEAPETLATRAKGGCRSPPDTCAMGLTCPARWSHRPPRRCRTGAANGRSALVLSPGEGKHHCLSVPDCLPALVSPALPGDPVSQRGTSGIIALGRGLAPWRRPSPGLVPHGVGGTVFHSITNSPVEPCRVFL